MGKFNIQMYEQLIRNLKPMDFVYCKDFDKHLRPCVAIRHDIDKKRYHFPTAMVENNFSVKATYFIKSAFIDDPRVIESLKNLQAQGFEIGLHNDCLSVENGDIEKGKMRLWRSLYKLMTEELNIVGISNHGDGQLRFKGMNNGDILPEHLFMIGIKYEAYHTHYTRYLRDIGSSKGLQLCFDNIYMNKITKERKEDIAIDDVYRAIKNEKTEILIHPQYWE